MPDEKPPEKKKNRGGAPTYLTQELIDGLAAIVRDGNFRYVARGHYGITVKTFQSWILRGNKEIAEVEAGTRDEIGVQGRLCIALDKAESEIHADIIRNVMKSDDLKLQMEYLRRRYNKLYSLNPNAHDDSESKDYPVDPIALLAEKLKHFLE